MLGCFAYAFTEIVEFWAGHHTLLAEMLSDRAEDEQFPMVLVFADTRLQHCNQSDTPVEQFADLVVWLCENSQDFCCRRLRFQYTLCHIYDISWHMYIKTYVIICVYRHTY